MSFGSVWKIYGTLDHLDCTDCLLISIKWHFRQNVVADLDSFGMFLGVIEDAEPISYFLRIQNDSLN